MTTPSDPTNTPDNTPHDLVPHLVPDLVPGAVRAPSETTSSPVPSSSIGDEVSEPARPRPTTSSQTPSDDGAEPHVQQPPAATSWAEVRARLDAATPGPWRAMTTGTRGGDHWYVVDTEGVVAWISAQDGVNEEQRPLDAEFIAHAPSDIAALLAEVERLRSEREEAECHEDAAFAAAEDIDRERVALVARAEAAEAALEAGDACGAVGCRALAERDVAIAALERVRDRDWLADVLASRCSKSGDNMSHVLCGELVHRQHYDEADIIIAALDGAHPTPSDGSGTDG